jgi:hypothetical protein
MAVAVRPAAAESAAVPQATHCAQALASLSASAL